MKRLLKGTLVALFAFLTINSFAQTEKGKILVSGASDFSLMFGKDKMKDDNNSADGGKSMNFNLNTQVGYFLMDNLAVGAGLGFDYSSYTAAGDNPDKTKNSSVMLYPFAKYYFMSGNMRPFLTAGVGFGSRKYVSDPDQGETVTTKYGLMGYNIGGGVAIFVTDNVAFDLGLGYSSISQKAKEDNPDNMKSITTNFGLNVGISVVF